LTARSGATRALGGSQRLAELTGVAEVNLKELELTEGTIQTERPIKNERAIKNERPIKLNDRSRMPGR